MLVLLVGRQRKFGGSYSQRRYARAGLSYEHAHSSLYKCLARIVLDWTGIFRSEVFAASFVVGSLFSAIFQLFHKSVPKIFFPYVVSICG